MQYYIHHDGQQQGPFDLETVRSRLADGSFEDSDLGWHEGAADWLPLSAIPDLAGAADSPPPVQLETLPHGQSPVQMGTLPGAQSGVQMGTLPRGQSPVQMGTLPGAQSGMQMGTLPRAQSTVQTGALPSAQPPAQTDTLPPAPLPISSLPPAPLPVQTGGSPAALMPTASMQPTQTSGLAVASMILGILSFFSVGLLSLPAVICGHLSLSRIKKAAGTISGRGFAITGLVLGYLMLCFFALVVLGIIAGIALPVFNATQEKGLIAKSEAEAKQIGLACKLYAGDNDGKYPLHLDDLVPTYLSDKRLFVCPLGKGTPNSGYNYSGSGLMDDNDPATPLLTSQAVTYDHKHIVVHLDNTTDLEP